MRLIYHRHSSTEEVLRIHLDERHIVTEDDPRLETDEFPFAPGDPDPDWVREYVFGLVPDEELPMTGERKGQGGEGKMRRLTREETIKQHVEEASALARAELATLNELVPFETEGMKLS